jgi:hypothetical protein
VQDREAELIDGHADAVLVAGHDDFVHVPSLVGV